MTASPDDAADRTTGDAFARFEQARRTNAKCIARGLAIRDELQQMKRRRIELMTMSKMNAGQRNVWLENFDEKTVIPYSKAWNRMFAKRVQASFPLEIRSMVYDYLVDDDMWDEYKYALQAVMSAVPPGVGHCRCLTHGHGLPRVPHYLFAQYMGSEAAQEIVAKVYRSPWFKKQTLYGIAPDLQNLIHEDVFGAGFDPASCITSLHVTCVIDEHRNPPGARCGSEPCQHSPYERTYIERDELQSDFGPLVDVVENKDFQFLEVAFMQRNIRIDVLEEALEAFKPVYTAFKKANVEMCIRWAYACLDLSDCDESHEHSRDLAKFFSDARFTWKRRMFQFLQRMSPCIQTRHIRFEDEPSLGLSDADFVHRMWESDEEFGATDDEDSKDDNYLDWDSDCDDSEAGPSLDFRFEEASVGPMWKYLEKRKK
ncbi:hypothetical protein N0V86_009770 [Didymella sp. IMI 355093]|nr:hypothetical protein N0V86_009770 [Didymella sp. IMI 355093]